MDADDAVDTGDAPRPHKVSIRLDEMIAANWDEALRIRGTQDALINNNFAAVRNPDKMHLADVFEATSKFLENIVKPQLAEIRARARGNPAKR